jgi:prepilin-type N-terminal cleavage/methylation domain-containing protein
MKLFFKNQYGFTLLELLVGMVIIIIIMGGVFNILSVAVKSYTYAWEQGINMQNTRTALTIMTKEIQNATAITNLNGDTSNTLSYTAIDDKTNQTINQTISLNNSKFNIAGRIIAADEVTSLTFTQDATNKKMITIKIITTTKAGISQVFKQVAMVLNDF